MPSAYGTRAGCSVTTAPPCIGGFLGRALKLKQRCADKWGMNNSTAKKVGRRALNGDGRKKHLRRAGKRAANKATRRNRNWD